MFARQHYLDTTTQLRPVVEAGQSELVAVSPYFVPKDSGVEWLRGLRQRGMRVVMVTNSLSSTDVLPAHAGYARSRKALLQAEVELWELRNDPARKDVMFLKLKALLSPFGITRYYTDKAGVYRRHLPPAQHTVGKLTRQKIERKHLTLRTRLKRLTRKTLCFSRSCMMHDLIIGLYINGVEFGCAV